MRLPQPPQLPRDRSVRLGLAATGVVLWWTLALGEVRLLAGLPLIALAVRLARRFRPLPPESERFEDWF